MRLLVAGWFSFANGSATAGDLLARDLVCAWLDASGLAYDVAMAPVFGGGVDVQTVDPAAYTHVLVVCGPFAQGELERTLLSRFWRSRLIGLDLSMQAPLDTWNPFDLLLERDSTRAARPELVFAPRHTPVPIVGVCLVEPYLRGATDVTDAAVRRLVASRSMAAVPIDTRLPVNATGFRTAAEIESVIARLDAIVTTRLHGMVWASSTACPPSRSTRNRAAQDPPSGRDNRLARGVRCGEHRRRPARRRAGLLPVGGGAGACPRVRGPRRRPRRGNRRAPPPRAHPSPGGRAALPATARPDPRVRGLGDARCSAVPRTAAPPSRTVRQAAARQDAAPAGPPGGPLGLGRLRAPATGRTAARTAAPASRRPSPAGTR